MKRIALVILIFANTPSFLLSQHLSSFESNEIGVAFVTDSGWLRLDSGNNKQLTLENPNHNLSVRLWFEKSSITEHEFLSDLLFKEGIIRKGDSFNTEIDGCSAKGVIGLCSEMRKPVRVLVVYARYGDGYYVAKFKCPEECFNEHKKQIKQLINSIRLINKSESHIYYTAQSSSS